MTTEPLPDDSGDIVAQIPLTESENNSDPGDLPPSDATEPDASATANDLGDSDPDVPDSEPETFPREYVTKLRQEAADARVKAKDRDQLAARLHTAQVAATGRLADPTDLPFDEAYLDDPEALSAAIEQLLTAKPHLASRRPSGDVSQGLRGTPSPQPSNDLAAILRAKAG